MTKKKKKRHRATGPSLRINGVNDRTPPWKWDAAAAMRADPTPGERIVGGVLSRITGVDGILLFAPQVPAFGFILDFYSPLGMLCVEVDGGSHASRSAQDQERDRILAFHGITTVRITEVGVTTDSRIALGAVTTALDRLGVRYRVGPRHSLRRRQGQSLPRRRRRRQQGKKQHVDNSKKGREQRAAERAAKGSPFPNAVVRRTNPPNPPYRE